MKKLMRSAAIFFILIIGQSTQGQILTKPDPAARFDRSKGMIVLHSSIMGSFFLDDHLLAKLKGNDTVYIINLAGGVYAAKLVGEERTLTNEFTLTWGKVLEVDALKDTLMIMKSPFLYEDVAEKAQGKTVFYLRNLSYFNITQTSFYTWYLSGIADDAVVENNWFRTFTSINGFQVTPGFCAGIGISYTNHNVVPNYNGFSFDVLKNVSFLPVYLDIRTHFSGRRVAPFIKFDIGYNILLTDKSITKSYTYTVWYENITKTAEFRMSGGGVYLSPGIGLRIGVNKLIQIVISAEYVFEKSTAIQTWQGSPPAIRQESFEQKMMSFKLNVGIGFQKSIGHHK